MSRRGIGFRVLLTVALLFLTVPWWPGLDGELAGIPAWAAFALLASAGYAGVVAWLLQRHWHDGTDDDEALQANDRPGPD
ncbi:MAG: hypothetical protein AAF736_16095 [Pseudomonadota bacterium]